MLATYQVVQPIIARVYGKGAMAKSLAGHLANKIAEYDGDDRERMILNTCWDWFSGGSTAEVVAREIEEALAAPSGRPS